MKTLSGSSVMVGIDVASAHVDVACLGAALPAELAHVCNDADGHSALADALVTRRRQLVAMQLSECQRLRLVSPVTRPSIEALLETIASQLDDVDAEMVRHVEQHHAVMPGCCKAWPGSAALPQQP